MQLKKFRLLLLLPEKLFKELKNDIIEYGFGNILQKFEKRHFKFSLKLVLISFVCQNIIVPCSFGNYHFFRS